MNEIQGNKEAENSLCVCVCAFTNFWHTEMCSCQNCCEGSKLTIEAFCVREVVLAVLTVWEMSGKAFFRQTQRLQEPGLTVDCLFQ